MMKECEFMYAAAYFVDVHELYVMYCPLLTRPVMISHQLETITLQCDVYIVHGALPVSPCN